MSQTRPFVHLHCHSHYSLLDGAGSIDRLVERAKDHGMTALALTDHGNLHGALEFYRKAKKADLNPIIGYEAYIAGDSRFKKGGREDTYHLTLLCQNRTGFRNLIKMASAASLEGVYTKPRIDKELLQAHSEGIIVLSGCVSSEFNRAILRHGGAGAEQQFDAAAEIARWFHQVFGDRYFIEIMNNGIEIQRLALEGSVAVANRLGIPLVATSDCHYVDKEDADAQDVMLCINTGKFRTDQKRMRMDGQEYYLCDQNQMYSRFSGLEDAVARSQEIADTVDIQIELGNRYFPVFNLPTGQTAEEKLRELCLEGLRDRYSDDPRRLVDGEFSEEVMQRLDRELGVINKLGFANYFLICWDFVREARKRGIPANARGSGVGALVCYALYLSNVCPLEYGLLFERFLDENRTEAPDIDIDFCKKRRGEIIQYVKEKYGHDSVAQIGTFGTLKARAAIKDVGRVLGIPLARVNQITAMVPDSLGVTLEGALQASDELRQAYEGDPEIKELIDFAKKLEGLARNVGTHAAAVVISDGPLTNYVPLGRVPGKSEVITQWSMGDVEAAGLLKMDFLGLRNLTVLAHALELIQQTRGEQLDLNRIPLDDPETYALLQRGETKGVFQLESGGIRELLQKMKPDSFRDIIATNALYRPGPLEGGMVDRYIAVKHGRKKAVYLHPVLEEVLTETHGVMVYQEQVMQILNRLGKIPLAAAYTCIKAISKKKEKLIAQNHEQFIAGAVESGVKKSDAQNLWDMILKFAGYGFNKSHSTAYAKIAYQTAYLKAHYTIEFMAALLTGDMPDRNFTKKDSLVEHLEDCRRMNIEVVPPSVNASDVAFTVSDGKIHFALAAIKGCGEGAAQAIVDERNANGPFKDLFDFCERVEAGSCGRATIESLIKAGAMDCFGAHRSQLMAVLDRALQAGAAAASDRKSGQKSLFAMDDEEEVDATVDLPVMPEMDEKEKLLLEKEVLGFYLTSHPLEEHRETLSRYCSHTSDKITPDHDRMRVTMGGMIAALVHKHAKSNDPSRPTKFAMFDLEDLTGMIRCIQWPGQFAEQGELVIADRIVIIQGRIEAKGDVANLIVEKVIPLEEAGDHLSSGIRLKLDESVHGDRELKDAYEIVRGYPGASELQLELKTADGINVQLKSRKIKVDINPELCRRLEERLGSQAVEMIVNQRMLTAKAPPKRKWQRQS